MSAKNFTKTQKRIKTLLKWVLLFFFSAIVLLIFVPIFFLIGFISKFWRTKIGDGIDELTGNIEAVTYTLDLLGCVTIFDWTWFFWKTKDGYRFGKKGETISFVLWKNKKESTLKKPGMILYYIINAADNGHFDVFEKKS